MKIENRIPKRESVTLKLESRKVGTSKPETQNPKLGSPKFELRNSKHES